MFSLYQIFLFQCKIHIIQFFKMFLLYFFCYQIFSFNTLFNLCSLLKCFFFVKSLVSIQMFSLFILLKNMFLLCQIFSFDIILSFFNFPKWSFSVILSTFTFKNNYNGIHFLISVVLSKLFCFLFFLFFFFLVVDSFVVLLGNLVWSSVLLPCLKIPGINVVSLI